MDWLTVECQALTHYLRDEKKHQFYEAYLLLMGWKADSWGRELARFFKEERRLTAEQSAQVVNDWLQKANKNLFETVIP